MIGDPGSVRLTRVILTVFILLSVWGTLDPESNLYYHPVYLGTLSLLGLNIFACLLKRMRTTWRRLTIKTFGYVLSHTGILVILAGALISLVFSARSIVWLGTGDTVSEIPARGGKAETLGCTLMLKEFRVDLHPSGSPGQFVSSMIVSCPGHADGEYGISVNNPLKIDRYRVFQSGFRLDPAQHVTLELDSPDRTGQRFNLQVPGDAVELKADENQVFRVRGLQYEPDFVLFEPGRAGSRSLFPRNPAVLISVENERDIEEIYWLFLHHSHHAPGQRHLPVRFASVEQKYETGLEIVRDPGLKWVMSGAVFLTVGLLLYLSAAFSGETNRYAC
jgi:cytochrome c biogenesis protein